MGDRTQLELPRRTDSGRWEKSMHLSKKALYLGIIFYSIALLIFQDWGAMASTIGTVSFAWLGKMVLDLAFAGMGFIRLAGPTLFAEDEADDEVAIHAEDLAFSDTALFGLFLLNVAANAGFHGYVTVMSTGIQSTYFSVWFMAEVVVLFLTWILFSHAKKSQARAARRSREAAQSTGKTFRGSTRDAA
jgi:hypothetical protein